MKPGDLVLVTGGAGYVGSTAVGELLARGYRVRVLDSLSATTARSLLHVWANERFELVIGDVRDAEARREALEGVAAVVHLAAIVGDPACARVPELARDVNLGGTRAMVGDSADAGVTRFVFASTCSNYGKLAEADAVATEDWALAPVSLYAETKVAAELEILGAARPGFATTCLRFATVYGASPRMRFDLTVNEFTRDSLVSGELVVYGEQFWRPYIHVHDGARALACVIEADERAVAGEVFNAGNSAENYRKQDLVDILTARHPETEVKFVAQVDDPRDYRVSFEKIKSALGFETNRTVPDGIDEVDRLLRSGAIADPFSGEYRN